MQLCYINCKNVERQYCFEINQRQYMIGFDRKEVKTKRGIFFKNTQECEISLQFFSIVAAY